MSAWAHVPGRFAGFLAALTPAPEETHAAAAAARRVGALLSRRFAEPGVPADANAPVLIGGFAKDTALGGDRTVDVAMPLPGPDVVAVNDIASVLAARFGAVEMSPDGWLTVGDPQDRWAMQVRILPVLKSSGGRYRFGGSAPGGCPAVIHPQAEIAAIDRLDRATAGKARDLLRLLKAWKRLRNVPINTIALERLAGVFLAVWLYRRRSLLFYDWMIRDFFFWMTAQAGQSLAVPGTGDFVAIGEAWLAEAWDAHAAASRAADRERDNDRGGALADWQSIFGRGFGTCRPVQPLPHRRRAFS